MNKGIEVSFHPNGFEINGHAIPETCYQVSILAWAVANTMSLNGMESYWWTSDYEKSNKGYSQLIFDTSDGMALWVFNEFKTNLTHWKEYYWKDDEVKIIHKDEVLTPSKLNSSFYCFTCRRKRIKRLTLIVS